MGEGRRLRLWVRAAVRLRTVRGLDAAGGRLAGAVVLSHQWAAGERLSATCWKSTSEGAAMNQRVRLLGMEDAWHCWGSPNSRRVGWWALEKQCLA
jgi:hypothetical protein